MDGAAARHDPVLGQECGAGRGLVCAHLHEFAHFVNLCTCHTSEPVYL